MKCRDCSREAVAVNLTMPRDPGTLRPDAPQIVVGVMDHLCSQCWHHIYSRGEA